MDSSTLLKKLDGAPILYGNKMEHCEETKMIGNIRGIPCNVAATTKNTFLIQLAEIKFYNWNCGAILEFYDVCALLEEDYIPLAGTNKIARVYDVLCMDESSVSYNAPFDEVTVTVDLEVYLDTVKDSAIDKKEDDPVVSRDFITELENAKVVNVRTGEILADVDQIEGLTNQYNGLGECVARADLATTIRAMARPCEFVPRGLIFHDPLWPSGKKTMPNPKRCWSNPPYTIVEFEDGDKVVAKCDNNAYDYFTGFMVCVAKKMFKTTTNAKDMFESCNANAQSRKRWREAERKHIKEIRQKEHERKKAEHKRRVQAELEQIRIKHEARQIWLDEEFGKLKPESIVTETTEEKE